MLLVIMVGLGTGILAWWAFQFYQRMDWEEKPEPTPDFKELHLRIAELARIEELCAEAAQQGKLSQATAEEVAAFCRKETAALEAEEARWKKI